MRQIESAIPDYIRFVTRIKLDKWEDSSKDDRIEFDYYSDIASSVPAGI